MSVQSHTVRVRDTLNETGFLKLLLIAFDKCMTNLPPNQNWNLLQIQKQIQNQNRTIVYSKIKSKLKKIEAKYTESKPILNLDEADKIEKNGDGSRPLFKNTWCEWFDCLISLILWKVLQVISKKIWWIFFWKTTNKERLLALLMISILNTKVKAMKGYSYLQNIWD